MSPDLVPALDPTPMPGPPWLFHVLLVLTFFLHALFMNLTLGGTLIAAISQTLSRGRADDHRRVLAHRLMSVNTYAISLAITTGVAPLLFVQVLYHQYFYTATILLGWIWFAFLGMLLFGYYATYLYKLRGGPGRGSGGTVWLWVAAVLFLAIACVHVAVNLIHSQPGLWPELAESPLRIVLDRSYVIRLLHFLLAALGFSALVVAWWSARRAAAGEEVELNTRIVGTCWIWAMVTTLLQVLDGFFLLLVLPREVLSGIMRGGAATLGPLGLAVLLGLGLLMMLARSSNPVDKPGLITGVLAAMTLTIAVMSITRHQVRVLYLAGTTGDLQGAEVASQWGNVALFGLLLLAGLATVGYMVRTVLRSPARGSDAA